MANPPITIGPFTNVPAPGSPIRSDWPQQISTIVTSHYNRLNALEIQAGTSTATTAANGNGSWSFNEFFPVAPHVVANVKSGAGTGLIVVIISVSTGGFQANVTTHAGAAFVGSVALSWVAMSTPVALARTDDDEEPDEEADG